MIVSNVRAIMCSRCQTLGPAEVKLSGDYPPMRAASLRGWARRDGWLTDSVTGNDLCPECVIKFARARAAFPDIVAETATNV